MYKYFHFKKIKMSFEADYLDSFSNESSSIVDTDDVTLTSSSSTINTNLLNAISQTLTEVISKNKSLKNFQKIQKEQAKQPYSSPIPPQISIYDYLHRIKFYGEMDDNTLVIALIYIDRLCALAEITLTYHNIHRILFTSVLIAVKYNEDKIYENKYYADIAGIHVKELNYLEFDFCDKMKFTLFITKNEFDKYESYLHGIISNVRYNKEK